MRKRIVLVVLLTVLPGTLAAQETQAIYEEAPAGEITEITVGSKTLYKFVNEAGETVIVDRPPAGYEYEVVDDQPWEPDGDTPAPQATVRDSSFDAGLLIELSLWILPLVVIALAGFFVWRLRKGTATRASVDELMLKAGYDVLKSFSVPREGERPVPVDYLARTPAGLMIVSMCEQPGRIEGNADAKRWVAGDGTGERSDFLNPLHSLNARVEALREITGDVPLFGQVVFPDNAEFVPARPTGVSTLRSFRILLDKLAESAAPRRELDGAWRVYMRHAGRDALAKGHARRREQVFGTAA